MESSKANGNRVKFGAEKRKHLPEIGVDAARTVNTPPPERAAGLAELQRAMPTAQVEFDVISGAPSYLQQTGKFLTGKNPGKSARQAVADFVNRFPGLFGHDGAALAQARVAREDVTAHSKMTTLVWQQQHAGIPLFKTIFKANVTADGELVTVSDHFLSNPAAAAGNQSATPVLTAKEAISAAAAGLGDTVPPDSVEALAAATGAEQKQRFAAEKLSDTTALLTWFPVSAEEMRLAWDVTTFSLARNEMYQTVVDAKTGELLHRQSLTADISNASYRVYADPSSFLPPDSPAPQTPGPASPTTVQAPEIPRSLVTLSALNTTASPNGWINDGVTETLGNNVDAHTDFDATPNSPDLPRPNGGLGRVFDFSADLTQAPTTYANAVVTHLFYMNNWIHDRLYQLGFTESAGNFQTDNFGRGGNGKGADVSRFPLKLGTPHSWNQPGASRPTRRNG
ncbi:MAG: M36 family metallopeptidase [Roseimicrobium sp.]